MDIKFFRFFYFFFCQFFKEIELFCKSFFPQGMFPFYCLIYWHEVDYNVPLLSEYSVEIATISSCYC